MFSSVSLSPQHKLSTLARDTVHHTLLFLWGSWSLDVSEEASECQRGPEGGLKVQRAADQADLLTETFDVGQHQQLPFIDLCDCH